MKKQDLDWAAAGLDRVGGDRSPRVPRLVKLESVAAQDVPLAIKAMLDALNTGEPIVPANVTPLEIQKAIDKVAELDEGVTSHAQDVFDELSSDLFGVQKDLEDLRRNYRHNLLRVFAAGVLVAWIAWTIVGGPS